MVKTAKLNLSCRDEVEHSDYLKSDNINDYIGYTSYIPKQSKKSSRKAASVKKPPVKKLIQKKSTDKSPQVRKSIEKKPRAALNNHVKLSVQKKSQTVAKKQPKKVIKTQLKSPKEEPNLSKIKSPRTYCTSYVWTPKEN